MWDLLQHTYLSGECCFEKQDLPQQLLSSQNLTYVYMAGSFLMTDYSAGHWEGYLPGSALKK